MSKEITVTRRFGMGQDGNPTKVYVSELSDGNIGFVLSTDREGMEPLQTGFTLSDTSAMSARLEIKRSIAPANLWHWVVVFDNGHIWCVSDISLQYAWMCWLDAFINGLPQLKKADKL